MAARVLVPARTPGGGVVLVLVDPAGEGARLERAVTTNREVHPHLHLDGAPVGPDDVVAGPDEGAAALAWTLAAARTGLCALAVGVAESALRQTAAYLNERQQFDRPLSSFQATMLRAADAAIDIEAMRVTLWQAAWRIDTGRPAAEAVAVAKWQASERGQRVVHATQHLHGGMGADVTYPIHRYFLWGKQIELVLGGPGRQLADLGSLVAARVGAEAGAGRAGDRSPPTDPRLRRGRRGRGAARARRPDHPHAHRGSAALASRDYQDVHHDAELARQRGSDDIFMNILTTNGLVGRFVTDWTGPGGLLREVAIRLGAPNYPGRHDDAHRRRRRQARARAGGGPRPGRGRRAG